MTSMNAPFARSLWLSCPVISFAVMFGHTTGVVNVSLAITGIALIAAAWSERASLSRWPLLVPIGLWAAWALAAVAWSAFPRVSAHAWLDEVLYPIVGFWAFWIFGERVERPAWTAIPTWLACALLALMSAVWWGHLQPPTPDTFPLHFYARVGHTSTLALFAIPLLMGLWMRAGWRLAAAVGVALCVFIGFASLNRFFWPAAAGTLFIAAAPLYWRRMRYAFAVFAALAVASGALVVYGGMLRFGEPAPTAASAARETPATPAAPSVPARLRAEGNGGLQVPPAVVAFDDAVAVDTRPKLWAFYGAQALRHAWIGVGFGKPLPGLALRARMPAELLALEPQAPTHAHNLFLNTWLQTGAIGAILQVVLLASLALRFWRLRAIDAWIAAAGIALVAGMITKNFTDDFMWKTTMLAFWSFAGLLLGVGERAERAERGTGLAYGAAWRFGRR